MTTTISVFCCYRAQSAVLRDAGPRHPKPNPLGLILACSELLQSETTEPELEKKCHLRILSDARLLQSLAKNMEERVVEQTAVEKEISDKAKEWIEEYGEDFLVDLIDVYLADTPNRVTQMREAVDGGDTDSLIREAHTLKSSSVNVGAMRLSDLAKQMEFAWRSGNFAGMADDVQQFEDEFIRVKAALEALKSSPAEFVGQER